MLGDLAVPADLAVTAHLTHLAYPAHLAHLTGLAVAWHCSALATTAMLGVGLGVRPSTASSQGERSHHITI